MSLLDIASTAVLLVMRDDPDHGDAW